MLVMHKVHGMQIATKVNTIIATTEKPHLKIANSIVQFFAF